MRWIFYSIRIAFTSLLCSFIFEKFDNVSLLQVISDYVVLFVLIYLRRYLYTFFPFEFISLLCEPSYALCRLMVILKDVVKCFSLFCW